MSVCGTWTAYYHENDAMHVHRLHCRSWGCVDCLPKRLALFKHEAESGRPTSFLTLTVNPCEGQSAEHRARELVDAMREMIRRARKRWRSGGIEYLAVFEETKKGEPHLHMLLRAPFIPQKWISATMDDLIAAPIVDIRAVRSPHDAASYIAKYLAKGPKQFGKLKRYWSTPGYISKALRAFRDECRKPRIWLMVRESLENFVESLTPHGVEREEVDADHWVIRKKKPDCRGPPQLMKAAAT